MEDLSILEDHFKKAGAYGTYNYCFSTQIESSLLPSLFGAVGGVAEVMKNKKVMGYLLNQYDQGICLIPVVADTLTKNKIDDENPIIINQDKIDKVVIKNDLNGYLIRITLKDKTKYRLRTLKKIKKVPYHEKNLNQFIKIYKKD